LIKVENGYRKPKEYHKWGQSYGQFQELIRRFELDNILDPLIGSGTTAIACERLNRRWIGIEIEEKYCEIAAKRIELEVKRIKRGFVSGENRKETIKRIKLKGFF